VRESDGLWSAGLATESTRVINATCVKSFPAVWYVCPPGTGSARVTREYGYAPPLGSSWSPRNMPIRTVVRHRETCITAITVGWMHQSTASKWMYMRGLRESPLATS
jgi:hypothetical protein